MQIQVTSTKVLTKGNNQYGDWKLVKVFTPDGTEYTTLADEADQIPPGCTINITDMDEDNKGKKFKKFEIVGDAPPVTQSSVPAPRTAVPPATNDMTPDMWEEKNRIKRQSIERQTSLCHILGYLGSLAIASVEPTREELAFKDKAIAWGSSRYDDVPAIIPVGDTIEVMNDQHQGKTQADKDFKALESAGSPKNIGELLTLCAKNGINKAKFLEHLGVTTTEGMDVAAAYEVIKGHLPGAAK